VLLAVVRQTSPQAKPLSAPDKKRSGRHWDNISLMYFPSFAGLLRGSFDSEFLGLRFGLFPVPFVGKMSATDRKFPQQLKRE
jgi:hypothetical protein